MKSAPIFNYGLYTVVVIVVLSMVSPSIAVASNPTPSWPKAFSMKFNETMSIVHTYHTTGTYYYDAGQNVQRIDRADGKGDRYCGSVKSDHTPCSHLVVDGVRYLVYPELKYCCPCCDAKHGCGVLKQDWLDGAEYKGETELRGRSVNVWNQKGLQDNYVYETLGKQVPMRIDEKPNDVMDFHVNSFKEGAPNPKLFKVPSYCEKKCPLFSICTIV
eukprot:gb/GECH01011381.1/.p1 GENE.gb/GECH01011381.1/~~gb/GECH01011381.1/.p1  ORF type:complete len:216 (+),score=26.28 gb/GECH01011381.1/:1-648(+)